MSSKTLNFKILYIFTILLSMTVPTTPSWAIVDPPNYNFSIDSLKIFTPGTNIKDIQEKYGKGEVVNNAEEILSIKFQVAHIRYKFPVIVQFHKGRVLDFYATLPSYFLHDIFHQSLINRFGKQNKYVKNNGHALYIWNNVDGVNYYYTGTCTITCFPIYFSGILVNRPAGLYSYKPVINALSDINL